MEHAQRVAAKTVRRVLAGSTLPVALAASGGLAEDDRALIQELSYGTLRFLGQVRAIVRELADRPLADASVEALLWVALYQLIHTRAPQHAVVNAAVQATERVKKSSARGLTNAILRNFLRCRDALLATIDKDDEARFSYPRWWIDRVRGEYAERAAAVLDALAGKYADRIVTCHGGAIETPEDFAGFLKVEPRLDGYVGGSSAERFPIEVSVTAAARAFKAVKLAKVR